MGKIFQSNIKLPSNWEVQVSAPLDNRTVISTAADRLLVDTWRGSDNNIYIYKGMSTICADTGDIYVYIGNNNSAADIPNPLRWKKIGQDEEAITEIPIATDNIIGGIKTGYSLDENNRKYPVETNETGNAYVHVNWTDTNDRLHLYVTNEAGIETEITDKTNNTGYIGDVSISTGEILPELGFKSDRIRFSAISPLLVSGFSDSKGGYISINMPTVSSENDGYMTKEDKAKLDGLTGAYVQILTKNEYDSIETKLENTVYYLKG